MPISLDVGFYVNLFEVAVLDKDIKIMVADRSQHPVLKELREEIEKTEKEIFVYAPERSDKVYGYGKDMEWLSGKGFKQTTAKLREEPKLAGRMILEGIVRKANELGYSPIFSKDKGRCRLFSETEYKSTSNGNVRVFIGGDVRVVFLRDPQEDQIRFGLIMDIDYSLRNLDGETLNYQTITSMFGSNTLKEVRQIQKDLIPTGINREASRQRLIEDIIPFVKKLQEIELPCGLEAKIDYNPSRVILGEENETLR